MLMRTAMVALSLPLACGGVAMTHSANKPRVVTLRPRAHLLAAHAESYQEQFERVFHAQSLDVVSRAPMAKPTASAQRDAVGAALIPGSDIYCTPMRTAETVDRGRAVYMIWAHCASTAALILSPFFLPGRA